MFINSDDLSMFTEKAFWLLGRSPQKVEDTDTELGLILTPPRRALFV